MRKWMLLTLVFSVCLHANAQVYTFTNNGGAGNGNWGANVNWTPGEPPNPLPSGSSIIIAANCTQNVNYTVNSGVTLTVNAGVILTRNKNLTIAGTLTNNGTILNNDKLDIAVGGVLTNNGVMENTAGNNLVNEGTLDNSGILNFLGGSPGSILNVQETGTLNNYAAGTINISGGAAMNVRGEMNNWGKIFNTGIIEVANMTGMFHNEVGGEITNNAGGTIDNKNMFENAGLLTNNGTVNATFNAGDVFTNSGTLINNLNLYVNNGGNLLNIVGGTITNNSGATLLIQNNGTLTNQGILNNNGLVTNENDLINSGTINNNNGGIINNGNGNNDQMINTGTINNNVGGTINTDPGATFDTTNGTFVNNGTYTGNAPLPIELVYFSATQVGNQVVVKWETATEKNNAYMEVQRSKDGIQFVSLHQEKGHGTTATPQQYNWTDAAPLPGLNYYRLRQVDLDGKAEYHVIVAVEFTGKTATNGLHLYPTEVKDQLTLVLDTPAAEAADLLVVDMNGRTLQRRRLAAGSTQEVFLTNELLAGAYVITLQSGKGLQTARFVKLQ